MNAVINIHVLVFHDTIVFVSLEQIPRNWLLCPMVTECAEKVWLQRVMGNHSVCHASYKSRYLLHMFIHWELHAELESTIFNGDFKNYKNAQDKHMGQSRVDNCTLRIV